MIGLNRGMVGTSAAGQRIRAAGLAYQAAHPETPFKTPEEVSPTHPLPAAVDPSSPPQRVDRPLTIGRCGEIIAETAAKYGITAVEIISPSHARKLLPARFEAIYRCFAETRLSMAALGLLFNRDRSTIGSAIMRHHLRTGAPLPRGMKPWVAEDPVVQANARRKRLLAARRAFMETMVP